MPDRLGSQAALNLLMGQRQGHVGICTIENYGHVSDKNLFSLTPQPLTPRAPSRVIRHLVHHKAVMDESLTQKQLEVLSHLAGGTTISRAARWSQVHRSTVYLWLENSPAFRAAVNHDRDVLAAATADRIRELQVEALDALEDVLCGPESTAGARLRAAVYVLEGGLENLKNSTQIDTF